MNIAVIGPSSLKKNPKLINAIKKTAKLMAGKKHSLLVTPNKGSIIEFFAKEFKKAGGKKIIGIIPLSDKEFGTAHINKKICTKIIDSKSWRNSPEMLCEKSGIFIAFGLSCGTMIELCYTKWFKVKKAYYFKQFGSKIPKEIEKSIPLKYVGKPTEIKELLK